MVNIYLEIDGYFQVLLNIYFSLFKAFDLIQGTFLFGDNILVYGKSEGLE